MPFILALAIETLKLAAMIASVYIVCDSASMQINHDFGTVLETLRRFH